jgi:AcrR family transcriptional regulator
MCYNNVAFATSGKVTYGLAMMAMTKTEERRAAIVDRLADHVLAHGLVTANLRPLAKAAGTSDRMLLYYFSDKAEIIGATLQRISERMVVLLSARTAPQPLPLGELVAHLSSVVLDDLFWPYMCVWLELASRAGRGDPLYGPIAVQIGSGFLAWGEAQLASPDVTTRTRDAARLLVTIEGMVLVKAIGMGETVERSLR